MAFTAKQKNMVINLQLNHNELFYSIQIHICVCTELGAQTVVILVLCMLSVNYYTHVGLITVLFLLLILTLYKY